MTPHEKAIAAVNRRLERLQTNLRETTHEAAQQFLIQSIVVTIAVNDGFLDYLKAVESYAQRRHGELKQRKDALEARHAELLAAGQELLEKFKTDPSDRVTQKELERIQKDMAAAQKELRHGASTLQRELSGSLGILDPMADNLRRLSEADQIETLNRLVGAWVSQVREHYAAASPRLGKGLIDAESWEASALAELADAVEFHDAYARAGFQLVLALELLALAIAESPPATPEEAIHRGRANAGARLKAVATRLAAR